LRDNVTGQSKRFNVRRKEWQCFESLSALIVAASAGKIMGAIMLGAADQAA